jgi:chorismate synthase
MAGNTFGQIFKITTFGESHGEAVGVVIDGCPAGLDITREDIQKELDRRKPGTTPLTSTRQEEDQVEILSGIFEGKTMGTPIALVVKNKDQIPGVYEPIKDLYRPGHADFTYEQKYGVRDWRGGGRASARETIGRVAAGAVAKKLLSHTGIKIIGYVTQIGTTKITNVDETFISTNPLNCPDATVLNQMIAEIETARKNLDSIGGIVEITAHGVPAGLGEPVFDKLSANLAHGIMSIPAVKGFEIGDGFACASHRASDNNDEWTKKENRIGTTTNHAGGIIGGISNGEDIVIRFTLKPASSIAKKQQTVDKNGNPQIIEVHGRHDPCVAPRAVPIGEAMVAITIADHYLRNQTSQLPTK